jgi:hypothetical protein
MNIFDRIDFMINVLVKYDFIVEEDVAWVALTQDQMDSTAVNVVEFCPIRHCEYIRYRGIEFRVSPWAREEHVLYPVWNVTKRTKDLFNKSKDFESFKTDMRGLMNRQELIKLAINSIQKSRT